MVQSKRWLWLVVANTVLVAGVGMLGTSVTLVLDRQGLAPSLVGLIQSLYFVGIAAGALAMGPWLARRGAVSVFVVCATSLCLLSLPLLSGPGVAGWGMLRLLQGACMAGLFASVEAALNQAVSNRLRGRVFALYQIVTYGGMAAGQWLVGRLGSVSIASFACASALFAMAALIAACFLGRAPHRGAAGMPPPAPAARPVMAILRSVSPLGFYVAAVSGLLLSAFYTVFPLVVNALVQDVSATGNYLALAMLVVLVPQLVLGHYADRHGRPKAVVLVASLLCLAALALALNASRAWLWSVGFVYSGLIFCVYGLGVGDVNDQVAPALRGEAATVLVLAFSLGGCLGPWLSGWAFDQGAAAGYFLTVACAAASMGVAGGKAMRRRHAGLCGSAGEAVDS